MPYYGDGLPYYYGGAFANHSSLITSGPRTLHTPLSRFSPHLSTISESPLSNLRRYSPVSVTPRPRRVIDTADIDVSTPRILSRDGSRPRNRLRRDRPTIKIRSQALKDNPALREHNEKHEKSVGELLVEKFLIKDKKMEEAEQRLRLFHQASLDREEEEEEDVQIVKSKIPRRFTRRRSSSDIQLDPEQLEREVTYAQVQAEVLDNLVAEEQAEIENEVRRGTLIRKGTIGGSRSTSGFFRNFEQDSVSQEEEEAAAQRIKKTLKKVKKKKRSTEKPSPPEVEGDVEDSRRSSTSSDVSMEFKREKIVDQEDEKLSKPQMYKIEASNSAGDFSTVWLNTGNEGRKMSIEQFRESVKIPVPRKIDGRRSESSEKQVVQEVVEEARVVLPVKRPYVKDTSRNSVYFTVKTPTESVKSNPLEKSASMTNGIDGMLKSVEKSEETELGDEGDDQLNGETESVLSLRDDRKEVKKPGFKVAKKIDSPVGEETTEKDDVTPRKEDTPDTKSKKPLFKVAKKPESPTTKTPPKDTVTPTKEENLDSKDTSQNSEDVASKKAPFKPVKKPESPTIKVPPKDSIIPVKDEIMAIKDTSQNSIDIKKPLKKPESPTIKTPKDILQKEPKDSPQDFRLKKPESPTIKVAPKDSIIPVKDENQDIKDTSQNSTDIKKPLLKPLKKPESPTIKAPPKDSIIPVKDENEAIKDTSQNSTDIKKPLLKPLKKPESPTIKAPPKDSIIPLKDENEAIKDTSQNSTDIKKPLLKPLKKPESPTIKAPPKDSIIPVKDENEAIKDTNQTSPDIKKPLRQPESPKIKSPKDILQKDPNNFQTTPQFPLSVSAATPKEAEKAENTMELDAEAKPAHPDNEESPKGSAGVEEETRDRSVVGISRDTNENSASGVFASSLSTRRLPKVSKINADENNAVEAPELSLDGGYLAKCAKTERDEDVVGPLPGKTLNKATSLTNQRSEIVPETPVIEDSQVESLEDEKEARRIDETTLPKGKKRNDGRKVEEVTRNVAETRIEDGKRTNLTKDTKSTRTEGEEVGGVGGEKPKFSFKTAGSMLKSEDRSEVENQVSYKVNKSEEKKSVSSPAVKLEENKVESKFPRKSKVSSKPERESVAAEVVPSDSKLPEEGTGLKKLAANLPKSPPIESERKILLEEVKVEKDRSINSKTLEETNEDTGVLSKSTSTESIDFWSEIKAPGSPIVAKPRLNFGAPSIAENQLGKGTLERSKTASSEASRKPMTEALKKKETDLKISVAPPALGLSNIPVIEEKPIAERSKTEFNTETPSTLVDEKSDSVKDTLGIKKDPRRKKKNLSLSIASATIKKTPLKREDSSASTTSENSLCNTPDTAIPSSQVSTPISDVSVPTINIVEVPSLTRNDPQSPEDEEDPTTPTNEPQEPGLSKWNNQNDLSNVVDKEVTPVPSVNASVACSPESSTKKKKIVKKKKTSVSSKKSSTSEKESKEHRKDSSTQERANLKPPEKKTFSPRSSPRNTPTQRPIDLIKMFYTTPTALLTATPRDLSKVRRAKIKRRKHQSRTPSVSSDSTGSTTSTATIESTDGSGSTCTELDDDPEHKRMNSTRSNDSGFDGSPRISNCDMACHKKCEKLTGNLCGLNQKLVAEALQSLKRAPSQSSDNQRNSDSSDHFASGRITPPATNLPRFKKYAVMDFNFLKVLGKGSFGKVLLAELRGTECVYAVKCLKKDVVLEDDDVECTLIERKVLTLATRHPYLCHLFCTFQTESHLFFVMEYLNGGDLMFHIQKSGRFPESRARFYAAEIWSGLNFLHKKGIVYRDLKLDNVLLDFEGHIRIADFGMCKLQIFLDRTADTFCGTPDYMAPEIIKGLKYNQAVDWWSYGVLLYEMLTGQSPFSGCDEDELFWSICNERPFIPRYLTQEATDILVALLEKDSGKRLPGHEIAMHSFFQSLPWDRLERRQLEAPFKPALEHTLDTKYFDTAFTAERPRLTPVPDQILTSMDQGVFRGFSYTNPNATD